MSDAKVELAQWIDCELIASIILEELKENDILHSRPFASKKKP